ncbi:hypothetical protein OIU78_014276 [Salix suchowensis]|nr:hypothetical protein OIU78_014276 [Salix suchowensis]
MKLTNMWPYYLQNLASTGEVSSINSPNHRGEIIKAPQVQCVCAILSCLSHQGSYQEKPPSYPQDLASEGISAECQKPATHRTEIFHSSLQQALHSRSMVSTS